MVLDYQSINKHLEILREYVADLLSYKQEFTKERLNEDRKAQHLTLYAFQMVIQSCLDIGSHIVAELSLRRPEENSEIFMILAEQGLVPKEFSRSLVKMVKFRNSLCTSIGSWTWSRSTIYSRTGLRTSTSLRSTW